MSASTDMGCSCSCSTTDYDEADVYSAKIVVARKTHKCCECLEPIEPGEKYEQASGCWEGSWDHYKTCLPCYYIRRDLCCGGWLFGQLRDAVWDAIGLNYITGEVWEG